jgi:hypothetical protein
MEVIGCIPVPTTVRRKDPAGAKELSVFLEVNMFKAGLDPVEQAARRQDERALKL